VSRINTEIRARRPLLDDLDAKILDILKNSPFRSADSISETISVGLATVLWRLRDCIGFRSFHLHWVSHVLIVGLCEKRTESAQAIPQFLQAVERDGWHQPLIDNESWFFLNTSPHRMWILSGDDVVRRPKFDTQSKKFMFTIIWNVSGFCVVDRLPNDIKNEQGLFCDKCVHST
jgi:hypothetical protein